MKKVINPLIAYAALALISAPAMACPGAGRIELISSTGLKLGYFDQYEAKIVLEQGFYLSALYGNNSYAGHLSNTVCESWAPEAGVNLNCDVIRDYATNTYQLLPEHFAPEKISYDLVIKEGTAGVSSFKDGQWAFDERLFQIENNLDRNGDYIDADGLAAKIGQTIGFRKKARHASFKLEAWPGPNQPMARDLGCGETVTAAFGEL